MWLKPEVLPRNTLKFWVAQKSNGYFILGRCSGHSEGISHLNATAQTPSELAGPGAAGGPADVKRSPPTPQRGRIAGMWLKPKDVLLKNALKFWVAQKGISYFILG